MFTALSMAPLRALHTSAWTGESDAAFHAFCIFRGLGLTRSLQKVGTHFAAGTCARGNATDNHRRREMANDPHDKQFLLDISAFGRIAEVEPTEVALRNRAVLIGSEIAAPARAAPVLGGHCNLLGGRDITDFLEEGK